MAAQALQGLRAEGRSASLIYGDNMGALAHVKDPMLHTRSKHINVHHHAVRERVAQGEVGFEYCSTHNMVAGVSTQGSPFVKCCRRQHFRVVMEWEWFA